jgi:hypothetical protein
VKIKQNKGADYSIRQFLKKNAVSGLGSMIGIGISPEFFFPERFKENKPTEYIDKKPVID